MMKDILHNIQRKRKDSMSLSDTDDRRFGNLEVSNPLIINTSRYNIIQSTEVSPKCRNDLLADDNPYFDSSISNSYSNIIEFRQAGIFSCFINLASTIVGAGLLGMPFALSTMGWVLGVFLLTLCGASSALALYFLTRCARLTKYPSTFHQVASLTIPRLSWLVDLAIAIKCFGVATSYMIVIGDLMPIVMHTFNSISLLQERMTWLIISYIILIPLTCFEHMDSLKYTSVLSFIFIFILVVVVLLYASYRSSYSNSILNPCLDRDSALCFPTTQVIPTSYKSLKTLPVFIFGYTCQQNTFSMVNELKHPSQGRMNVVIALSVVVAWCIYMVTASAGFITYGYNNKPNLLTNYPGRNSILYIY